MIAEISKFDNLANTINCNGKFEIDVLGALH